jgi:hypothetical protein
VPYTSRPARTIRYGTATIRESLPLRNLDRRIVVMVGIGQGQSRQAENPFSVRT